MTAETCTVCGATIRTMIYRGTGVCGQLCEKTRARLGLRRAKVSR